MTDHHQSAVTTKDDTPRKQTPGEMLRTQRESAGLTLQAVSEALHLTVHYIKSLENDEYAKLPGLTFVKGYFRAYARYLRMDVDAVLANYENYLATKGLRQHVHDFSTTSISSIGSSGRSDQSFAWALMAGVILVIALAAGWWFFGREMEVGLSRTAVPATPSASTTTSASTSTAQIPAQSFTTPQSSAQNTAQGFTQNFSTTTPTTTAPLTNDAAVSASPQAAADAGVAVINATLEARQEEQQAQLANTAQASDGQAAAPGVTTSTPAPGTTTALNSYAAPATTQATATAPTTVLDNKGQEVITDSAGARIITLHGSGNDRFEIQLNGNSWAEVHDAQGASLFSNMLRQGDKLNIEGTAPFVVLLGDARQVQASFNAQAVDLSSLIRTDNTARFRLGAEGVSTVARDRIEQATATE
jgi:cytoskeleton protein RodZ